MAAKIVFLFALLIIPSLINAQSKQESFSIELKLEKINYAFGEEVKPVVLIKNISGKKDSLTPNEIEDVTTANNLQIFQNSKRIGCQEIYSSFVANHNKIFEPGEEYQSEVALSYFCGNETPGRFSVYNILDTGFYNCYTYVGKSYNPQSENPIYKKFISNEIFFRVHPPDSSEWNKFSELKEIFNFSQEKLKDTSYMLNVLKKLDNFTRVNINSFFGDAAIHISTFKSGFYNLYINEEVKLVEFYLSNKPNGQKVSKALYFIYNERFQKNKIVQEGLEILENYIVQYPNTKIETEAKKIITDIQKEEKLKLLNTKKPDE